MTLYNGTLWNDTIHASPFGDHTINGGGGDDLLFGGNGSNVFDGGLGSDGMLAGAGKDIFKISQLNHSTAFRPDVMMDFNPEMDRVDLSALDLHGKTLEVTYNFDQALPIAMVSNFGLNFYFGFGMSNLSNPHVTPDSLIFGHNQTVNVHIVNSPYAGENGWYTFGQAVVAPPPPPVVTPPSPDVVNPPTTVNPVEETPNTPVLTNPFAPDTNVPILSRYYGSDNDDIISSDPYRVAKHVSGLDGNDNIAGGHENDILGGNAGSDTLNGAYGDDTLRGGRDDDLLEGEWGDDTLRGNMGNDTLKGSWGDDLLAGGRENDLLEGSWGDDLLDGQRGNDTLTGGHDVDNFYFNVDSGNDVITDFQQFSPTIDRSLYSEKIYISKALYTAPIDVLLHSQVISGDTVIDLGSGNSITIIGYDSLTEWDIEIY